MRAITASGMVPSATAGRIEVRQCRTERAVVVGQQAIDQHEAGDRLDVVGDVDAPADRRDAQGDREQQDQQDRPPENRHRVAGERKAHHRVVGGAAATQCRDDAGGNANQHRQQHRADREFDGGGEMREELAHHAVMCRQRGTQIAVQCAPDIQAVLHDQRAVQAKLRAQVGKLRRIDVALAEQQHHRIARDQVDQAEGEYGDAEECHQHQGEPAREEQCHAVAGSVRRGEAAIQLDHVLDGDGIETLAVLGR